MARYKKYRYGGKKVPGMFKKQDGGPVNPTPPQMQSMDEKPMMQASGEGEAMMTSQDPNMQVQQQNQNQNMMVQLQKQKMQQQMQMQKMMMQMKLQNEVLKQQNELMQTRLEKLDMINSARTTQKIAGSQTTPKRYGGGNKKTKTFIQGNAGNVMKRGGGLPGGRFSKKRK
jgi:hypothetical protein